MRTPTTHKQYCFAGQPASCTGYFANDKLPCICGADGDLLAALSEVAIPTVPLEQFIPEVHLLPLSA